MKQNAVRTQRTLNIGIVAGEKSGDALGAGLMQALRAHAPNTVFSGLGGPAMLAQGFVSLAPMERLSVMGLVEPLARLPELVRLRKQLYQHFIASGVDLVVGIDSPDFNLGLEKKLRARGLRTCHYVCPSVWAWRQGRVKKLRAAADHVLALLPFEAEFLQ
ncbi:MAG: lipid-A-disaccharide synthase, partial [Pseudomonadales bacterium]|nr:lipid-A-disaccharide synthase [Pseudomonadales bacterium]